MSINKIYAWGSTACVIAVVLTGLILSGTPDNQRQQRFDQERVSDIKSLTWQIENFRNEQSRLPGDLEEMVDGRRLNSIPRDPENGMIYMYSIVSENSYRLCADFNLASAETGQRDFWDHESGYHCYEVVLPEQPVERPPVPR